MAIRFVPPFPSVYHPRSMRSLKGALALLLFTAPLYLAPACASHGPSATSRMSAARTMAEGFGYTPFGASETGKLEEGKDAKITLKLNAGCYQIFAFPDDGLRGIDLSMQDPAGKAVGTSAKQEGQSTLKHCVTETGSYTLVLSRAAAQAPTSRNRTPPTSPYPSVTTRRIRTIPPPAPATVATTIRARWGAATTAGAEPISPSGD
jgi:hypothetical protein